MKNALSLTFLLCLLNAYAQDKYFTKTGKISFFSSTPIENIEAHNNRVTSIIETSTGNIEFSVLIRSFKFEKALMEEHFNENYMESDKYPKSVFKGKITNIKDINFQKDGAYEAKIEGDLTIHGVTQKIMQTAKIEVKGGKISANCNFKVKLADYNIKVPSAVGNKIAEEIDVKVQIEEYQVLKK
jgi:polyisoprenoid-binding protein YceI